MQSALYQGVISHQRTQPKPHRFTYSIFMVYLKLDELQVFFDRSRLWSLERFNWASFRRDDFLHPHIADLQTAVQQEIHQQTGEHFTGDIYLLTHIRYLGYCFNPVSLYYCYQAGQLRYILAEINNTPWNERHCHVLVCGPQLRTQHFCFSKNFHVSPFLPMDMEYDWRFTAPQDRLTVFMRNTQSGAEVFNAGLILQRQEATPRNLRNVLLRFPAMTVKTIAGIYWQALRLWLKGTPFHDHPVSTNILPEVKPHGIIHARQNQLPEQH